MNKGLYDRLLYNSCGSSSGGVTKGGGVKSMEIGGRDILNVKIVVRSTQKVKNKSGPKILTRPARSAVEP